MMAKVDELFTEISNHFDEFKANHETYNEKKVLRQLQEELEKQLERLRNLLLNIVKNQ